MLSNTEGLTCKSVTSLLKSLSTFYVAFRCALSDRIEWCTLLLLFIHIMMIHFVKVLSIGNMKKKRWRDSVYWLVEHYYYVHWNLLVVCLLQHYSGMYIHWLDVITYSKNLFVISWAFIGYMLFAGFFLFISITCNK